MRSSKMNRENGTKRVVYKISIIAFIVGAGFNIFFRSDPLLLAYIVGGVFFALVWVIYYVVVWIIKGFHDKNTRDSTKVYKTRENTKNTKY